MHAIYARVSTEEQARSGYSLSDQVQRNKEKLYSLGVKSTEIMEFIDDGYSGEFLDRPDLQKLRQLIEEKIITGYVCITDPDRLSRNLTNTLLLADEFQRANLNLVFVTAEFDSSPEGKLFFSIRGAVAAFEKAKTRERTMRGKKTKALSGKIVINRPIYGYDWDAEASNYIINAVEAEVVHEIYNMCLKKKMGLRKISTELNSRGLKNKVGNKFTIKNVYRILTEDIYQGMYYEFKEQWEKTGQKTYNVTINPKESWVGVPVPAIVTAEEQELAKKQLSNNSVISKRNRNYDYLLTGIVKCGICGKGMVAISYPRNGRHLRYYICYGKRELKICPTSAYVPVEEIETAVWDQITRIAEGKEFIKQLQPQVLDKSNEIEILTNKRLELIKQKDKITNFVLEDLIDADKARKKLQELNKAIKETEAGIVELNLLQKATKKTLPIIKLSDVMAASTIKDKHEKLKDWGVNVIIYKHKGEETQFEVEFK